MYTHAFYIQGFSLIQIIKVLLNMGFPSNRIIGNTIDGKIKVDMRDLHPETFDILENE